MKDIYLRWMAILIFFFIPFNIKKYVDLLIPSGTHLSLEFSSFFLFFSELLVLIFLFLIFFYKRKEILLIIKEGWPFLLFVLVGFVSISSSDNILFGVLSAIHIGIAVLFLCSIAVLFRTNILSVRDVMKVFAINAIIQEEIGVLQFFQQVSLGLRFLGEETIGEFVRGIAKIDVPGMIFLRSYGTLPHPNIFGGILFVGLVAWMYLFITPSKKHGVFHRSIALVGLFITVAGLIVSFSRSAWIASVVMSVVCILFLFFKKQFKHAARELILFYFVIFSLLFGIFGWLIVPRASVGQNDSAIQERVIYSHIAETLIFEYPFGVGIGNSIIRAEQEGLYGANGLTNLATHQPVHNIYLLIVEELGLLGLILFLVALLKIFIERRKNLFMVDYFFPSFIIMGLLGIGFFDHYIITSNVGRLMFFGVLGIIIGLPKINDRKSGRHL